MPPTRSGASSCAACARSDATAALGSLHPAGHSSPGGRTMPAKNASTLLGRPRSKCDRAFPYMTFAIARNCRYTAPSPISGSLPLPRSPRPGPPHLLCI